jgi:Abnormal spindle-like microcephaly-assoc'd, ASPM-SPD-2-Hydin
MMRSRTASLGWPRILAAFLALAGAMLLISGRAVAEETGIEDNPPAIGGGAVSPSSLSHDGGNVQLSAEVTDDFGVSMVYALVYNPDGSTQLIQLYQGGPNTYYGTLEVPPNGSNEEAHYGVEIQAWDTNGGYAGSLIGDVQEEAALPFDQYPYVVQPEPTPSYLPAEGGPTTISVYASDDRSVANVYALLTTLPGGGDTELTLSPRGENRYEGTFTAPANSGPLAAEYLVEIIAEDDIGQQTRLTAGTLVVEAPPVPPSIGQLKTSPGTLRFGSVRVGKIARGFVVVRNGPRKHGAPVQATARIVGSSAFSLAGASAAGIHFVLDPGQKQAFPIKFNPTAAGQQTASLEIVRDDGGQQGIAVALSGRGTCPTRRGCGRG